VHLVVPLLSDEFVRHVTESLRHTAGRLEDHRAAPPSDAAFAELHAALAD